MPDRRRAQSEKRETRVANTVSQPALVPSASSGVAMRSDREALYELWSLYLAWRTSGEDSRSESDRVDIEDRVRRNAICEIEAVGRALIAPHFPSAHQVNFLVALLFTTADLANRFNRADRVVLKPYSDLAFEIFWNGLFHCASAREMKETRTLRGRQEKLRPTEGA